MRFVGSPKWLHILLTRLLQDPQFVKNTFEAIQSISDEARRALDDPELSREQLLSALSVRSVLVSH